MSATSCTILNELRLEGELCDVVIVVDGVKFKVHKNILCSCSHYFRVLFIGSWKSTTKTVYKIPGTSPDMMRLIIEYAYMGTVPITINNVERLLITGDQFNIMGVIQLCSDFLKSQLCLENCVGIYKLTDYYYCPDLQEAAFTFILHHFEDIIQVSTEFVELPVNKLTQIIEMEELNVKDERAVFEAILKWIAYDPQERKQHFVVLLSKVRLALMQVDYFLNNVKSHQYVKNNKECQVLIIETMAEMYNLNTKGPSEPQFNKKLSQPRLPSAVLFAIGGWSGESPTNAIETYDSRTDKWINVTFDEESPLAYHGTAYLKGFLYIIGGFDGIDYFNRVKRFNLLQKTWQQVGPMHSQRCYVSVTVLDDLIYAIGGFDGYVRLNTAERYEPETNQWTLIAPMHKHRSNSSATTLHGKVYVCGGFNGTQCSTTAEVYNPTTNQWTFIAPMTSRRSGLGVIANGNKIYAVGGCNGAWRLRSAEVYNPVTNTWRLISRMISPRSNFGIEVVDNFLCVVGGSSSATTIANVECYDENTDKWYHIEDMSINRGALSCCVVPYPPNIRDYIPNRNDNTDDSSNGIRSNYSTTYKPPYKHDPHHLAHKVF